MFFAGRELCLLLIRSLAYQSMLQLSGSQTGHGCLLNFIKVVLINLGLTDQHIRCKSLFSFGAWGGN